jgi:hypothetical protein
MHHANHFYGHAHIMARYAGLDSQNPPRILGYLQHGWNILDGFAVSTNLLPGLTKFVWSDSTRRRGWSIGRRNYFVMGAPWNYLLSIEPPPATSDREGTIWYPFHGWEGQQILGDHDRLIAQIRETETEPVTVCLYFNEYRNPKLRGLYERAGFRVISHGVRGRKYEGTDRKFLYRQLAELRRHRRVASNRLGSASFYGISVGCEPAVYGDPMILQAEDPAFGGVARMQRLWPELHGQEIDIKTARDITRVELGQDYLATPGEIREIFSWARAAKAGVR